MGRFVSAARSGGIAFSGVEMTSHRNLALGGAALLIAGLFCPIVTLPFMGSINLFNDGTNVIALGVMALAAVAAAMALNNRVRDTFWPGAANAAILIYHFIALQVNISQMKSKMAELKDNPFAGFAQAAVGTVQLQWGWLVLAVGAGLMIYAGVKARREVEQRLLTAEDGPARTVAGASILVAVLVIGLSLFNTMKRDGAAKEAGGSDAPITASGMAGVESSGGGASSDAASAEEAAYIKNNLRLYDLETNYRESMLDGRVPGVDFKIKNEGNRTLNRITVRVVFQDAQGKPIAEEEYNPVWVVENSYSSDDNTPLRPNYIWQNERDKFYTAKSVPSEWAEGKATATITKVEFASK